MKTRTPKYFVSIIKNDFKGSLIWGPRFTNPLNINAYCSNTTHIPNSIKNKLLILLLSDMLVKNVCRIKCLKQLGPIASRFFFQTFMRVWYQEKAHNYFSHCPGAHYPW